MRQRTAARQSWILTLLPLIFLLTMNLQAGDEEDSYLWLEEVLGSEALDWVETQNDASRARLESDERFAAIRDAALAVYSATDRIAYARHAGERVFNFWQDERHVRGILRAASIDSYLKGAPEWETLLDIDVLAEAEGENWVYKGSTCLRPDFERCMISLSRGGADAVVVREFNVRRKAFVEDGFTSDEAKQGVEWLDQDHLLIGKAGSGFRSTDSGYSAEVRLWKRSQPLEDSRRLFEVPDDYVSASPVVVRSSAGAYVFAAGSPEFFREQVSYLGDPLADDSAPTRLPLPEDIDWRGMFGERIIALTRSAWEIDGELHPAGALIAVPLDALLQGDLSGVETVLVPPETGAIQSVQVARSHLYVSVMDNVRTRLVRVARGELGWTETQVDVPSTGTLSIVSATSESDLVFVNGEEFLVPDSLYAIDGAAKPRVIAQLPMRFDASAYVASQSFAMSADGTRVPYFLIKGRDAQGPVPTLLYGYGGFEISLTPSYLSPLPVSWLEAGGAYAIANIRGGGEFGPAWHQAALQANRQRAYDDFAAVAEDLTDTGVTAPAKLGIYGGSNGGLLVGALLTQRPELFGAVVCAVPLLDMLRYHKLLAGASWIGEYGDPDVPEERAWLAAYSPYHNVRDDLDYPQVFLTTSTRDDRVHPGHARKMAAKMMAAGHDVVYYENTEGGHSAAANLNQVARRDALVVTFLMQALMDGEA
ncbi:MAG: prolyl oligopeptidase family serine peptidase [Gammaproteobacteria bacterium]|nr:prolyl oligopeptidase family serine peptidase [Gammaproteobacteria bacterium]